MDVLRLKHRLRLRLRFWPKLRMKLRLRLRLSLRCAGGRLEEGERTARKVSTSATARDTHPGSARCSDDGDYS